MRQDKEKEALVHLLDPDAGVDKPWHSAYCGLDRGAMTRTTFAVTCEPCVESLKSRIRQLASGK